MATSDVLLQLLNDEFLLGDDVLDQVPDRDHPDQLVIAVAAFDRAASWFDAPKDEPKQRADTIQS